MALKHFLKRVERVAMTLAISTDYIFGRPSQPDHHVSFPAAHGTDWLPLDFSQQTPFLYSLLPLALPPPPRIFSIIRNLEAISKLARFRHGKQRHLCSLLHTSDPNKPKPSDLLTHAIFFTFSIILHSPQNSMYPSPACWAPNCSVLSCLTASGSVWQELLAAQIADLVESILQVDHFGPDYLL